MKLTHLALALILMLPCISRGFAGGVAHSVALIYRGPGACVGCPETLDRLLRKMDFHTVFVGPGELTVERFAAAQLYVQPGGTDYVEDTTRVLGRAEIEALRDFVRRGGRYLGICAGGYLAGEYAEDPEHPVPAFGLIPGIVREESTDRRPRVEPILWKNKQVWLYFQDGPYFDVAKVPGAEIWASYEKTGHTAAAMIPFGKGRVGLLGPHPEAEQDWFDEDHVVSPEGPHPELAIDFINALLR